MVSSKNTKTEHKKKITKKTVARSRKKVGKSVRRKKKFNTKRLLPILIFILILVLPSVFWYGALIISNYDSTIIDSLEVDTGEKREKATFSNAVNVFNVTGEIEKVYNDRVPFRSRIINRKKKIDAKIEEDYKDVEDFILSLNKNVERVSKVQADKVNGKLMPYMDEAVRIFTCHGLKKDEVDPFVVGTNYPLKLSENEKVIIGQSNWKFLNSNNIPYYTGTNNIEKSEIADYILPYETINRTLKEKNKQFAIIVCPEKEEIYTEYMPAMDIIDKVEKPIKVREYIATNSDVIYKYPKEKIIDYKKNYRLYFKNDSHWNQVGGYIGYNEIKKSLGMDYTDIDDLQLEKRADRGDDLLKLGGFDESENDNSFEYYVHYKDDIFTKVVYIDNAKQINLLQLQNTSGNGKKAVIIGDSYRSIITDYLSKDFEYVTAVSFTNMADEKVSEALKEADLIIFESVTRSEGHIIPLMCQRVYQVFLDE